MTFIRSRGDFDVPLSAPKRHRLVRRAGSLAAALVLFALLVPLGPISHPVDAAAYTCNGGNTKYTYGPNGSEADLAYYYTSNPYPNCGWIGYIAQTRNQWYNSVSQIGDYNVRTWVCGHATGYDYSYWVYNTNWVAVQTPIWFYGNCGRQVEFHPSEQVNGQWGWSSYLSW